MCDVYYSAHGLTESRNVGHVKVWRTESSRDNYVRYCCPNDDARSIRDREVLEFLNDADSEQRENDCRGKSTHFDFPVNSNICNDYIGEAVLVLKGRLLDQDDEDIEGAVNDILAQERFESAVKLMDGDIREQLHHWVAPCSEAEFLAAYIKKHEEKLGETWICADPLEDW